MTLVQCQPRAGRHVTDPSGSVPGDAALQTGSTYVAFPVVVLDTASISPLLLRPDPTHRHVGSHRSIPTISLAAMVRTHRDRNGHGRECRQHHRIAGRHLHGMPPRREHHRAQGSDDSASGSTSGLAEALIWVVVQPRCLQCGGREHALAMLDNSNRCTSSPLQSSSRRLPQTTPRRRGVRQQFTPPIIAGRVLRRQMPMHVDRRGMGSKRMFISYPGQRRAGLPDNRSGIASFLSQRSTRDDEIFAPGVMISGAKLENGSGNDRRSANHPELRRTVAGLVSDMQQWRWGWRPFLLHQSPAEAGNMINGRCRIFDGDAEKRHTLPKPCLVPPRRCAGLATQVLSDRSPARPSPTPPSPHGVRRV